MPETVRHGDNIHLDNNTMKSALSAVSSPSIVLGATARDFDYQLS